WAVSPQIAPVYYNSLNGGSSIDPMFADNSQSGDVNVSYGIQVSYKINQRLSVRSGVNNVNVSYTTGGLELANSPESAALSAIDHNGMGRVLTAFDKGTVSNIGPSDANFGQITPKAGGSDAEMNQQIRYYELPLELKYALLDRKIGIHFIGGLSTLFLGDNEVSVRSGSVDQVIGQANNLNDISFSTNIGLGFDYKLSQKFTFNLEPMFKYQLNTYTDSSVDFSPYTMGVYTGLSFRF
ncbi:MAG: outer membrane beta-barrel protein, partial [Flavobacteriaceae bacterium]|nr:outer membrane beta-barrel protein [Flavobacteriaceae bacterium]